MSRLLCIAKERCKASKLTPRFCHSLQETATAETEIPKKLITFDLLKENASLDEHTYSKLVWKCIDIRSLDAARRVHRHMIESGFDPNLHIKNNMINMYAKCGSLGEARQLFDEMPDKNDISWNSMLSGYAHHEHWRDAMWLYKRMQMEMEAPLDGFAYVSLLKACGVPGAIDVLEQVIGRVYKSGLFFELIVGNAILAALIKHRIFGFACQVFDNMPEVDEFSWTTMIAAFSKEERPARALDYFKGMQRSGLAPDFVALSSILVACGSVGDYRAGKQIHAWLLKHGSDTNVYVATRLSRMYTKCFLLEEAWQMFDEMPTKDLIACNAMIAAFAGNGKGAKAIEVFGQLQNKGFFVNHFTYGSVLKACSEVASLQLGQQIHAQTVVGGFYHDAYVGCTLADMYVNCGSIDDALEVFEGLLDKEDVVSWNVMINGFAQHGNGRKALVFFYRMVNERIRPNGITLVGALSACSHMGMVDEGWSIFDSMLVRYGLRPQMEHYACMVDLLGRAGRIQEAKKLLEDMPFESNAVILRSLLSACRVHGDLNIGKGIADQLSDLEPWDDAPHVLLSNIYASAGMWDEVKRVRKRMRIQGVQKGPGTSWIEVKHTMHCFLAEDRSHPQSKDIYAKLEELSMKMREAGILPDKDFVLHDVEPEQKEWALCYHSEKLAVGFGLLNTAKGMPIRVFKNLRVCGDCHNAIKFISKVEKRHIIVRDNYRFHHFEDGVCSCQDYW